MIAKIIALVYQNGTHAFDQKRPVLKHELKKYRDRTYADKGGIKRCALQNTVLNNDEPVELCRLN